MNQSDVPLPADTVPCVPDPDLSVGYLLTAARTRMLQEIDMVLNPYGLTGAQFTILRRIAESSAHTAADLCRLLQYDTGSMTRMLDRLEEKGVICRERSPDDRRVVNIRLTDSGANDYPTWREKVSNSLGTMFNVLSDDEQTQLRALLGRLVRLNQEQDNARS